MPVDSSHNSWKKSEIKVNKSAASFKVHDQIHTSNVEVLGSAH
jgi:hypothetical protein